MKNKTQKKNQFKDNSKTKRDSNNYFEFYQYRNRNHKKQIKESEENISDINKPYKKVLLFIISPFIIIPIIIVSTKQIGTEITMLSIFVILAALMISWEKRR